MGRTVTLKLRLADFTIHTHAASLAVAVADRAQFAAMAEALLADVLPLPQPVRLMGLTLSALEGDTPSRLVTAPEPDLGQLALF